MELIESTVREYKQGKKILSCINCEENTMFEWKVEDLKLRKEAEGHENIYKYKFNCEHVLSAEEKVAFVDALQNGKLSYILNLAEKYAHEKDTLPKDKYGSVRTGSLKAWLNRNDTAACFDKRFHYGKTHFLGVDAYIENLDLKGGYRICDNYVDEVFHAQLMECLHEENNYFKSHDEYSVLKAELLSKSEKMGTTFGVHVGGYSSDGDVVIIEEDEQENWKKRPITIPEIKELLEKYEQVEQLIAKLTADTHIVY